MCPHHIVFMLIKKVHVLRGYSSGPNVRSNSFQKHYPHQ